MNAHLFLHHPGPPREARHPARPSTRIRSLDGGEAAEIIVVDGDPAGETLCAIPDGAVRKLLSEPGRGRQLNRGAGPPPERSWSFSTPTRTSRRNALAGSGKRSATMPWRAAHSIWRSIPRAAIFRLIERVASLRTRITRIPYGDQAIFLRRACFRSLGGFHDLPIMEDVDLMRRLQPSGGRIVILPERAVTSARRWEKEGVLYTTLRNWALVALFPLGVDADGLPAGTGRTGASIKSHIY